MARPSAEILGQQQVGDNIWQILKADAYFVITYKGDPINLRVVSYNLDGEQYKYKKLTYTNLGNALAQARLLNHRFHCEDFDVVAVDVGLAS